MYIDSRAESTAVEMMVIKKYKCHYKWMEEYRAECIYDLECLRPRNLVSIIAFEPDAHNVNSGR